MSSLQQQSFLLVALVLGAASLHAHAQTSEPQEGPLPTLNRVPAAPDAPAVAVQRAPIRDLNNDAIVRMTKADIGDSIILQTIRSQPGTYATAPDDLIALKNAGVSQAVISAMLGRNSGMAQHAAPTPVEVTPLSPEVDDPGVYFKNKQGQWEPVSPELVKYRSGGAAKSVLTRNIVKKDRNGLISGPSSTLHLSPGTEMLILAPRQADAVEYLILRLRPKSDRREFRVETGNVFHEETGSDRDQITIPIRKISSRVFAFTVPADLQKGQYGVLPPGSASTPGIGFAGKIYTFSISE